MTLLKEVDRQSTKSGTKFNSACQQCISENLQVTSRSHLSPSPARSLTAECKRQDDVRHSVKMRFTLKVLRSLMSKRTWVISPDTKFTYQTLDLRKSKLENVPENATRLELLQAIRLDGNERLDDVKFLGKIPLLRVAAMKNCQLTSLSFPSDMLEYIQLRALEVYNNPYLADFSDLGRLSKLQHLNIGSCNIEVLPNELFELKRLRVLVLDDNPLLEPITDLSPLDKLEVLLMRNCNLTELPHSLRCLPQLMFIAVEQNQISHISATLNTLENLQVLSIYGNRGIHISSKLGRSQSLKRINVDLKFCQKNLPNKLSKMINVWKDTPCAWWKQL
nr:leucine-rich repeat protein lrrA-like [Ciona intestinalis]|eukprot:XP_002127072.3 leucine-rich repeat protein lrrA-like [Ciona intestinalis]